MGEFREKMVFKRKGWSEGKKCRKYKVVQAWIISTECREDVKYAYKLLESSKTFNHIQED